MQVPGYLEAWEEAQLKKRTDADRRSGQDRRQKSNFLSSSAFFAGRRKSLRRREDCRSVVTLDWYQPTLFIAVIIVLSLSLMDGVLTLVLIHKGAVELNPVMRFYLALGPTIFVLAKYGITALAVTILVVLEAMLAVRCRLAASLLFPSCVILFGSVILWELYLLGK